MRFHYCLWVGIYCQSPLWTDTSLWNNSREFFFITTSRNVSIARYRMSLVTILVLDFVTIHWIQRNSIAPVNHSKLVVQYFILAVWTDSPQPIHYQYIYTFFLIISNYDILKSRSDTLLPVRIFWLCAKSIILSHPGTLLKNQNAAWISLLQQIIEHYCFSDKVISFFQKLENLV